MGCDYYGTKDDGEMLVQFRVYKENDVVGQVYSMVIPVSKDGKIYQEISGDIRER